MNTAKLTSLI